MEVKNSKMYIIRTRPLRINDLVFALRSSKSSHSSLEVFERAGLVVDMKPEWVVPFVDELIKTHPADKKDFEHFLIDPPPGTMPSDVIRMFQEGSKQIPTLSIVYMQKKKPIRIEKIYDFYHLLSVLADARDDGLVEAGGDEAC